MINLVHGMNMLKGPGKIFVIPVNCVGTMGNGLAKYFSIRHPEAMEVYYKACREDRLIREGYVLAPISEGRLAVLFATKIHWRDDSIPDLIDNGLLELSQWCTENKIKEIEMPMIGCGKGNLDWENTVFPMIVKHFENHKTKVNCYV